MPAKKLKSHTPHILILASISVITSSLFIISNSPPQKTISKAAFPTVTPIPSPSFSPGIFISPNNLTVGSKFGDLTLREIKPITSSIRNFESNLAITFQGQIEISGKFTDNNCFNVDKIDVINSLPRFSKTNPNISVCFTNIKNIKDFSSEKVIIDNYTIENLNSKYTYYATYIKPVNNSSNLR